MSVRASLLALLGGLSACVGTQPAPDAFEAQNDSGSETEANFVPMETGEEEGMGGAPCDTDEECVEGLFCNDDIPTYGGHCSECGDDEDCVDSGLGVNCTFTGLFFECGQGAQGEMCDGDEGCEDPLQCVLLLFLGAIFDAQFCSECEVDADCSDGLLCHPQFSLSPRDGGGEKVCVAPGTAVQSSLCDFEGSGDSACASGHCESVDIGDLGQFTAGICGECETGEDCESGICNPGIADLNLILEGSTCEP